MPSLNSLGVVIPEGGVLSPLFFSFFLFEIKHIHLHGISVLYTDDLQVTYGYKADKISIVRLRYNAEGVFKNANYC